MIFMISNQRNHLISKISGSDKGISEIIQSQKSAVQTTANKQLCQI